MTRLEALESIKQGNKITHQYFLDNEYLFYKDGEILTEDGYNFEEQFWGMDFFENGWSTYNK